MTEQQWRVTVDKGTCIGSGVCTGTAAGRFSLVGERSQPAAELIDPDEAVLDAAESCPVEAILVRAAETGEVLAPEP
ncbi:ferredoxin [Nocardia sp. NEAU-G5]|uniref:Ferredoxin n=1 Tax=Nocardia albiluteola TaxID=2842303 RepID=A0ABS6AX98_9NOCA|nr:ferredoxin [Nocardia albiluteola]MBU3062145.1 ferredoxin [Nocardia albiluteola]